MMSVKGTVRIDWLKNSQFDEKSIRMEEEEKKVKEYGNICHSIGLMSILNVLCIYALTLHIIDYIESLTMADS